MRTFPETAGGAIGSTLIPAAASRGISQLLEGPPVPGVLLGESSAGAWLRLWEHVIVVAGAGSARLPNGVNVGASGREFPHPGAHCMVGDGRLFMEDAEVEIVRWWDPRPLLQPTSTQALSAASAEAYRCLDCRTLGWMVAVLLTRDAIAVRRAMRDLLGRGEGLTPEGDDVIVGVLAGLRLLGPAVGAEWAEELLVGIEPLLFVEAPARTTSLSVTLLRHAAAGEVAEPVGTLLQALTGRGDPAEATGRLLEMGASSGQATACGVMAAAAALTGVYSDDR